MPDDTAVVRDVASRRPPAVPTTSRRPGRPRVAREIVDSMQGDIAQGRLPLGSRLPSERELARHYGVSQPTVREAVRALDVMGLVDVRHGSGVYVTRDISSYLTSTFQTLLQVERVGILDVMELRTLLGTHSARMAARRATAAEIALMQTFIDASQAANPSMTPREIVRAPVSFQLALTAASGNPLLFAIESFLTKVVVQVQLDVWDGRPSQFWCDRIAAFDGVRSRIIACVAAHNEEGAVRAVSGYLENQYELFRSEPELAGFGVTDPVAMARALDEMFEVPEVRLQR